MKELNKYEEAVKKNGELPACAIPGGYPVYYWDDKGNTLCADCASRASEDIADHTIYWEGAPLNCEECNEVIESAYGDPDDEE